MCGSKHTSGGSIKYRTLNSSSKIAELKHTLIHKCTIYSSSRLFHQFLMSARSGSTRYHNVLSNEISSYRTSYYIDGPVHSVFAENLNLCQVKGSGTQIPNIHYYIEEIYPFLIYWWECTLSCYFAGVNAAFLLC